MLLSTRGKIEQVKMYHLQKEKARRLRQSDGAAVIGRLMNLGMSLREISRVSPYSATYLSTVKNSKAVISSEAYLCLLMMENERNGNDRTS